MFKATFEEKWIENIGAVQMEEGYNQGDSLEAVIGDVWFYH